MDSIAELVREADVGRAREWLRSLREAVRQPLLMRYLGWKYGQERLLSRAGRVYPAVCYGALQTDVESVLGALDASPAVGTQRECGEPPGPARGSPPDQRPPLCDAPVFAPAAAHHGLRGWTLFRHARYVLGH